MLPYLEGMPHHLCFLSPNNINFSYNENKNFLIRKIPFSFNNLDFFYYNNFSDYHFQPNYNYSIPPSLKENFYPNCYNMNNIGYFDNNIKSSLSSQISPRENMNNNLQNIQIPKYSIKYGKSRNVRRNIKEELINKIFLSTISTNEESNGQEMLNKCLEKICFGDRELSNKQIDNFNSYFFEAKMNKLKESDAKESKKELFKVRNHSEENFTSDSDPEINSPFMSKQRKKMNEKNLNPEFNEPKSFIRNYGNKSEIIKLINMKNIIQKNNNIDPKEEIKSPDSKIDNNASISNQSIFDLSPFPFSSAVQKVELKFKMERDPFNELNLSSLND